MVTAISFGPRLRRFVQRAASTRSAVESGPPETARTKPGKLSRPRNSARASSSETASSAVGTLLFPVHALLHAERGPRIFAQHLAQGSAGCLLLAQRRKRLAEPQQGVGSTRGCLVFGGHGEERLGGIMILLILEQGFAEPELRLGRQPVARILMQEPVERRGGEAVVLVQEIAVGEIVLVLGRIARR